MPRKNYFEIITDLSFDPVESNSKVIEDAITNWYKKKQNDYNKETVKSRKDEYKAELDLKSDIEKVLKDQNSRAQEARDMKALVEASLKSVANILHDGKDAGEKMPITQIRIRKIAQLSRVKEETAKRVFLANGFEMAKARNSSTIKQTDYFYNATKFKDIQQRFNEINAMVSQNKYEFLVRKANSVYECMALINYAPKEDYAKKPTVELKKIIENLCLQWGNRMSEHEIYNFLFLMKDALKDEDSRDKLDNSFKLAKLDDLLNLAKGVPDSLKRDEDFAENVIKKIQKEFPDYDLALYLYNFKTGIVNNPYEPEDAFITVTCGNCNTPLTFSTINEAQKAKCPVCGDSIYTTCPNNGCHKLIPNSIHKCTYCGFDMKEYRKFDFYLSSADSSLQSGDYMNAKQYFQLAKNANSSSSKLGNLEKRIKTEEAKYQKPLDDLNKLIQAKKYVEASAYLITLKTNYPKLNVSATEADIRTKLNEADRKFNSKPANQYDAANVCINILNEVADYTNAIEFLRKVPPRPVTSVQANYIESKNGIEIKWSIPADQRVDMKLIRKENSASTSFNDGKVIYSGKDQYSYMDKDVLPGVNYYYTLFVVRDVLSSPGKSTSTYYTIDLNEETLLYTRDDHQCIFTWTLPANVKRVRIDRICQGKSVLKTENAIDKFEDQGLDPDQTYQYKFSLIYEIGGKAFSSSGYTITPVAIPSAVLIKSTPIYNRQTGEITISLNGNGKNNIIHILDLTKKSKLSTNSIENVKDLSAKFGPTKATGTSLQTTITFKAEKNKKYNLAVVTLAGGDKAVLGNNYSVDTFEKIEIDKDKLRILNGNTLSVSISQTSLNAYRGNIESLWYAVSTKVGGRANYIEPYDSTKLTARSFSDYSKTNALQINNIPTEDVYITLYLKLKGNKIVGPAKAYFNNAPKKEIKYDIVYPGMFSKKTMLKVECESFPDKMYLVGSMSGVPMGITGGNIVNLLTLGEKDLQGKKLQFEIPADKLSKLPKGAKIRLFIDVEDTVEYKLKPLNVKNLDKK